MAVGWLARRQKERRDRLAQLERVLLGIAVHGPSTMHEPETAPFVRWTVKHWQDAHRQIMAAAGPPEHSQDCGCWDCVLRLNGDAARHQAELMVRFSEVEELSPW